MPITNTIRRFLLVCLVVVGIFHALQVSAAGVEQVDVGLQGINYNKNWVHTTGPDGDPVVALYTPENKVVFVNGKGESTVLDQQGSGRVLSGMAMDTEGSDVHMVWREKSGQKKLWYARSTDGGKTFADRILLDTESQPLVRIKLVARGDRVFITWLGEKPVAEAEKPRSGRPRVVDYNLYFKYSTDRGKTFSDTARVVQGILPQWVVTDKAVHLFSWQSAGELLNQMVTRRFDLASNTWGKPVAIAPLVNTSMLLESLRVGERLFLAWQDMKDGNPRNFQLRIASSSDAGQHWQIVDLPILKGLDFTKIAMAHDGNRHVYLVGSASRKLYDKHDREKIYLLGSSDNGVTWKSLNKPRHFRFSSLIKTNFPSIAVDKNGMLAVGWEDWRGIRPNFYFNVSKDFGKTWLSEDIPLGVAGIDRTAADPRENTMGFVGDTLHIFALPYVDDRLASRNLVRYSLDSGYLKSLPPETKKAAKKEAKKRSGTDRGGKLDKANLKQRIERFWQAMVDENYEATYYLYDPFLQARTDVPGFLSKRGKTKYYSFEVGNLEIRDNVARVSVQIEYDIPGVKVRGEKNEQGHTEKKISSVWLYVGDQWYREFRSEETGVVFTEFR